MSRTSANDWGRDVSRYEFMVLARTLKFSASPGRRRRVTRASRVTSASRVRDVASGFTLIELMLVLAIATLLVGGSVYGIRSISKTKLRTSTARLGGAMRYAFNQSLINGRYLRLAIDLDEGKFWLEQSDRRISLRSGRKQHATYEHEEGEQEREGEDDAPPAGGVLGALGIGGSGAAGNQEDAEEEDGNPLGVDVKALTEAHERDQKPPKRARALFTRVKLGSAKRGVTLEGDLRIAYVMTSRLKEPADAGIAFVYFFPQGHAEPAVVILSNGDGPDADYYSVVLHPLTGETRVYSCRYRIPKDFGLGDATRARTDDGERCVSS